MSNAAKSSLPVVLATAAVTTAVGVTIAALGGYFGPREPAPATSQQPETPAVVPSPPDPEPTFASRERHHHDRHHEHDHEDER